MKKIILFAIAIVVLTTSCSIRPDCVTPKMEGLMLSWGEENKIKQEVRGYTLDDKGKLYYYEKKLGESDIPMTKIRKVDGQEFCDALKFTVDGFLENQVIHTPGVVSRFVELRTPVTGAVMHGKWNPTFKLNGSEEFVEMYEELMKLVPEEDENKGFLLREVSSNDPEFQLPKED